MISWRDVSAPSLLLCQCEHLAWQSRSRVNPAPFGNRGDKSLARGKDSLSKENVSCSADYAAFTVFTVCSTFRVLMERDNNLIRLRLYLIEFSKVRPSNFFVIRAVIFNYTTESYGCCWHHVTFLLVLVKVEHLEKTARVKNARGSKGK